MANNSHELFNAINLDFYKKCSEITEGYEKVWGRWSQDSQLLHIMTEVAELKDVLRNKNGKYGKPENLINIGYLEPMFKISWQCVECKGVFVKREKNPQPRQTRPFSIYSDWNEKK